jgi:adenylosuccinate synthase
VKIAVAYRIDGRDTEQFPMTLAELERAEPVYESHPGWRGDVSGCRRLEDLPAEARDYVKRVEALVGIPVELISVGPGRDETIERMDSFRPR